MAEMSSSGWHVVCPWENFGIPLNLLHLPLTI
jgi:hypothetical protein